jgi:hypothetical protein
MERIADDPFIPQPRVLHPALAEEYDLPFDMYPPLFEEFFSSPEFSHWSSGQKQWQLHCYGGPGCGKV